MGNRNGLVMALNKRSDLTKALSKISAKDPNLAKQIQSTKLDWYKLKNQADEETADLYIYDEIMPAYMAEWFGGVSAQGLIEELNEISASTINVRINSPGGAVFEAIAIYNALISHSAAINVYVDSLAASAASVIAMAGDKITMMVGSQMMIHDAMGLEMGNAAEMREYADFLDRQSDNIASIYAEKSGGDAKDLRGLMLAETWLYPEEAVELGLADEVYTRPSNADPAPEEEDPDKESEPDPEDPNEEEEPPEPDEEDPENLMNRRHSIVARGFKYAGRRRAPAPPSNSNIPDSELDKFIAALAKRK
jgi:ATP-dependent protease ClpP protease subunit